MIQGRLTDHGQELGEEARQLTELSVGLQETAHYELLGNKQIFSVKTNSVNISPFFDSVPR